MYLIDQSLDSGFIEVYVGNSRKQAFDQQFIGIISRLSVAICRTGKADQSTCQLILKTCNICLFAANTSSAGTAFASGCLLTLKTKHLSIHLHFLLMSQDSSSSLKDPSSITLSRPDSFRRTFL